MSYQQQITARIEYLRAELDVLARLVALTAEPAPAAAAPARRPAAEPKPAAPPKPAAAAPEAAAPPAKAASPKPAAAPPKSVEKVAAKPKPATEELPPEPEGTGEYTIDPAQAAEILGIARQTVDRRLKGGGANAPGAPADVSGGSVRSRWRWRSEADVRRWWAAVG